jgi:hypothetical protein
MDPLKVIKVRVTRPFLLKGKRVEIGDVVEVDRRFGVELKTANKAEYVTPEAAIQAAAAADMKPLPAAKTSKAKEQSNARE